MAQFGKDHDFLAEPDDRVEIAYLLAEPAQGAGVGFPFGNHRVPDLPGTLDGPFDERPGIRLFHVQIDEDYRVVFGEQGGKVG